MIARITTLAAAAVLAVGAALAAAVPASAAGPGSGGGGGGGGSGGGSGGGCNGPTCDVYQWIKYTGSGASPSGGTGHVIVNVPPPPCLWVPEGDQITGSQFVVNWSAGVTPGAPFDMYQTYLQAKKYLQEGAAAPVGTWYMLPVNPNAPPSIRAQCALLPMFFFARPGQAPPLPPIPIPTLEKLAFNHMTLSSPQLTINPAAVGFVNLATFVWWTVPNITAQRTMAVTARVGGGGPAATVVAQLQSFTFGVSNGNAMPYEAGCSFVSGSGALPVGQAPPGFGAGAHPDCGVLWTGPSTGAVVSVTLTWRVLFHSGADPGFFGTTLPGVPAVITTVGTSAAIPVREIQSVNGG